MLYKCSWPGAAAGAGAVAALAAWVAWGGAGGGVSFWWVCLTECQTLLALPSEIERPQWVPPLLLLSLLYPYHTQLTLCLPPHSLPPSTLPSLSLSADYFNMRLSIERSVTLAWHGPGSGSCKRNTQKILLKNTAGQKPKTVDPACLLLLLLLPCPVHPISCGANPSQAKASQRNEPGVWLCSFCFSFQMMY